jgi:hypothetical protein
MYLALCRYKVDTGAGDEGEGEEVGQQRGGADSSHGITPKNRHEWVDFGPPAGKEAW